jgi:gamma-glutamyltranspeptidase/glutathione hydrolase
MTDGQPGAVRAPNGMVVSPHPLATQVGVDILRAGGTAVDAAIAANAVLSVVYCHSCGLGGDAFALVWWPPDGRLHAFNGSGRAPKALTIDLLRGRGHAEMPERGPLPITVPGAVDAWEQLASRFGRRPLAELLGPAARIAEEGHELTAISAGAIARSAPFLDAAALRVFQPAGRPLQPGERLVQPMLAVTLRRIGISGADAFYRSEVGSDMARAVQAAGGVLAEEDLATHSGQWVEPISTTYGDVEVATAPPNSQGITALIALNVLTALTRRPGWTGLPSKTRLNASDPLDGERLHAQLETLKVAWAERDRCVADPERMTCDIEALLTASHAEGLASRLDPERAGAFVPSTPPGGGTVFLCAADADGCMVSLIESNWMGFGSGVMGGSTGVMLQNRGNYFSLDPAHPNHLAPGARTLHTLTPAMLLRDGRPWVALGSMGGDGQPQYLVQLVNALVNDGLDPQQAVDRPRFVAEVEARGRPLKTVAIEEDGVSPTLIDDLRRRGHGARAIPARTSAVGWAQVIRREPDGSYTGGADPRADSLAAGL